MGLGDSIKMWAIGSIAGKIAQDGGPISGLGQAFARKYESDPDTPDFVRSRLRAERIGRQIGWGIKSARDEFDD